ncbi:AAA family ATPase [Shewanella algae]|uniref:retron Ec78 anti-phage system effector ATPase PtuA n=1 Tax=Shewanella algae TaxID=38313 RepID=UPI001AAE5B1B|nr:retron Ec78 anti-phage system effector ATPase PtuA [Shewanella algae]MBO2630871.1 AAA family ATPase [Shewanella algae]
MSIKQSRTIKRLIKDSEKGKFSASYQLYKLYSDGYGISDSNIIEADKYKKLCAEQLSKEKFRIQKIHLENFKSFESFTVEFPNSTHTTVFVGNNGGGKSTVLESLKMSLTHARSRISTKSSNGDQISIQDIKIGRDYSKIVCVFSVDDVEFPIEIYQSRDINDGETRSKYSGVNELGNIFKSANTADPNSSFPLLASYTVERANDVTTKDIEESDEIKDQFVWNKSIAYHKSLTGKADFRLFFRWIKELIEQNNLDGAELNELKAQIKIKEDELKNPLLQAILKEAKDSDKANSFIRDHKEQLNFLYDKLNSLHNINSRTLSVVENAIYNFLPGFKNLKLYIKPLDLTVEKDGVEFSILQLSQGEKSILALVADISRRLIILNPGLDNPLLGSGVVLIDELDLHLHPSWQQKIIDRLENTFPNIQFIVSTHSPQICHTVDSENIWIIRDGKKYRAPKGVRGGVSSWVLKKLFEVEERPPEDYYTQLLNDYHKLVYADQYDSNEAKDMYFQLIEHFGQDYPYILELRLYIENREWEKEIEKSI